ncbi:hypothetical protein [Marinibacterium sp. SX1]|uniref:hypothetical protein n=1 Tax=Marinibacterium sp. SX1 TaxID=3388424 RepID=UPI003D1737A4
MPVKLTNIALAAILAMGSLAGTAQKSFAQTFPIDCAILLCLSDGWPASAPCARARAEFIRRITPWPVEPPLQIWRCPMGASYYPDSGRNSEPRIYDALIGGTPLLPQSIPIAEPQDSTRFVPAVLHLIEPSVEKLPKGFALRLVQDRADIDISGPEFNFVRSIRVFDVRYARQGESGSEGDCERSANIVQGTYGTQGDFSWARSSTAALPDAHVGLERWGDNCPSIYHRSVFVDWRDYEGNYGFEQVNY